MNRPAPGHSLPLSQLLGRCANAVAAVRKGQSLNEALAATPAPERPGTQALAFTVMRRMGLAQALRHKLVPKAPHPWVDALLISALALIDEGDPPADLQLGTRLPEVCGQLRRWPSAASPASVALCALCTAAPPLLMQSCPLVSWQRHGHLTRCRPCLPRPLLQGDGKPEKGVRALADGKVHVRPVADLQKAYEEKVRLRARRQEQFRALRDVEPVTKDGHRIKLQMNAGLLVDLPQLADSGADGIGLFRTELQFMISSTMPKGEEQESFYRNVLKQAAGRPVTFRTLDIGGDKVVPYFRSQEEENPALGWRAIRLSLDRPGLLRTQLRAIHLDVRCLRCISRHVACLLEPSPFVERIRNHHGGIQQQRRRPIGHRNIWRENESIEAWIGNATRLVSANWQGHIQRKRVDESGRRPHLWCILHVIIALGPSYADDRIKKTVVITENAGAAGASRQIGDSGIVATVGKLSAEADTPSEEFIRHHIEQPNARHRDILLGIREHLIAICAPERARIEINQPGPNVKAGLWRQLSCPHIHITTRVGSSKHFGRLRCPSQGGCRRDESQDRLMRCHSILPKSPCPFTASCEPLPRASLHRDQYV